MAEIPATQPADKPPAISVRDARSTPLVDLARCNGDDDVPGVREFLPAEQRLPVCAFGSSI